MLGKNVEIDSSGEVVIEDDVWFSEGSQVHSHYHVLDEDRIKRVKDKIVPVLIEGPSDKNGKLMGYTDTMKLVNVVGSKDLIGKIVKVKITDVKTWSLDGVVVDD